jgi:outer membrane protein OmpA-like peptidoglycan-associated protein
MTYMTTSAPFGAAPATTTGAVPLNQRDVMSAKIDVFAQRALFRMLKGNEEARLAARHMVWAVKRGALAGIYKEDQRAPALRARAIGKGWWQLIPKGSNAMCLKEPASRLPMLVFRNAVRSNSNLLDPALKEAWESCGISPETPPPYEPKAFPGYHPPPPPGDPIVHVVPTQQACNPKSLAQRLLECKAQQAKCEGNCLLETGLHNYPPKCIALAAAAYLTKSPKLVKDAAKCMLEHGVVHPNIQHLVDYIRCSQKGCRPWLTNCINAAKAQPACSVSGLGQPACAFETGEEAASRTAAGILTQDVSITQNGILVADFGVDRRSIKATTKAQLAPWIKELESDRVLKIRIYGLTDCSGKEGHNNWLRKQRALRVYAVLGPKAKKKVAFAKAAPDALLPGKNDSRVERAKNRGVLVQFDRSVDIPEDKPIAAAPCHEQLLKKAVALVSGTTTLPAPTAARLRTALLLSQGGGNDAFIRPGQGSLAIPFHWTTIKDHFRMLCNAPDPKVRTTTAGLTKMMQWLDDDIVNGRRSYQITRQQASSLTRQMIDLNFTSRLNAMLKDKSRTVYAGY